jgi:hypothetical protein
MEYGISIWDVVLRHGYLPHTVILDIDMGYGLMIWEMTVSIWSSLISHVDMGYLVTLVESANPTSAMGDLPPSPSKPG